MDASTPGPEWRWNGTRWLWWNGSEWQEVPTEGEPSADDADQPPTVPEQTSETPPDPPPGPPPATPLVAPPTSDTSAASGAAASIEATPRKRRLGGGAITAIAIGAVLLLVLVGGGVAYVLTGGFGRDSDVVTLQTEPLSTASAAFTPAMGTDTPVTPAPVTGLQTAPAQTEGLYGGTLDATSCDKTKLVAFLQANPDKARVWAATLGISQDQIPTFVAGLTPLLLRSDTAVTNHGYENGQVTTVPAVLQAGTAVLVDDHGQPVVKCYCGNPLTAAPANLKKVTYTGPTWPSFQSGNLTIVQPAPTVITNFVVVNVATGASFVRPTGTDGGKDTPGSAPPTPATPAPTTKPTPSAAPTTEAGREAAAIALATSRLSTCLSQTGYDMSQFGTLTWGATPTGAPGEYLVTATEATSTLDFPVNVDTGTVRSTIEAGGCPGVYD